MKRWILFGHVTALIVFPQQASEEANSKPVEIIGQALYRCTNKGGQRQLLSVERNIHSSNATGDTAREAEDYGELPVRR